MEHRDKPEGGTLIDGTFAFLYCVEDYWADLLLHELLLTLCPQSSRFRNSLISKRVMSDQGKERNDMEETIRKLNLSDPLLKLWQATTPVRSFNNATTIDTAKFFDYCKEIMYLHLHGRFF
ncbi:unnamed protein product [Rhizophagus irregularis]|nr:unnamed protein product [Rhizophagus irregularis]CAB5386515.1 unnamed protein product [Rhizophagus irregularis]